jgi:uncharacterized protein (UPF0264 family)
MTRMLASVASAPEAWTALDAGVDLIDLKDPASGALGALPLPAVAWIVAQMAGRCVMSATLGDLPMEPRRVRQAVSDMSATGVGIVKLGVTAADRALACIDGLGPVCAAGARVVVVLFADVYLGPSSLVHVARSGCAGVMLDTAGKSSGGLRRHRTQTELHEFVSHARALGLMVGLAGSLTREDIPSLLSLDPDYLGFRGALCVEGARAGPLDRQAVERIRALIPRPGLPEPREPEPLTGIPASEALLPKGRPSA